VRTRRASAFRAIGGGRGCRQRDERHEPANQSAPGARLHLCTDTPDAPRFPAAFTGNARVENISLTIAVASYSAAAVETSAGASPDAGTAPKPRRWGERAPAWALLLAIPLLLAQIPLRKITEPYPALLMPAGASLLRQGVPVDTVEREIYIEDGAGRRQTIAAQDLLANVPTLYRPYLLGRGLGLLSERDVRRIRLGKGRALQLGRPLEAHQAAETRAWLRARAMKLGFADPARLILLTRTIFRQAERPSAPPIRTEEETSVIDLRGPT
jgi:hypothetical protein